MPVSAKKTKRVTPDKSSVLGAANYVAFALV